MKNILITGAGSYIGVSLENYLGKWAENYRVDSLDMCGTDWENHSFRGYDAVFHVAGLVHQPDSKTTRRALACTIRSTTSSRCGLPKKPRPTVWVSSCL